MNLVDICKEYGVKNVRVFIPLSKVNPIPFIGGIGFRSSNDPRVITECEIDERRYAVSDAYKVGLRAIDPAFGSESFYTSDFESLRQRNPEYSVYVLTIDGYTKVA